LDLASPIGMGWCTVGGSRTQLCVLRERNQLTEDQLTEESADDERWRDLMSELYRGGELSAAKAANYPIQRASTHCFHIDILL